MRLLVTGVAGFVGTHLVRYLAEEERDVEIYGLARPHGTLPRVPGRVSVLEADLEDAAAVDAAVELARPDRVVHLAAQSSPHRSWSEPEGTLRANVFGLLHLLESLRKQGGRPRVLVVGSSEEYGLTGPVAGAITEDAPLRPNSPYAVSKVAQGYLALQYTLSHGIPIVRTRTFHHTGPGRGEQFVESSFARQLVEIERGRTPAVLSVGNLEAIRDFADVRDVVRAYWALVEKGEPGEVYNVCTGRGLRIRDLMERLLALSGVTAEVRMDPDRLRPSDIPLLVGDPSKLRQAIGWTPRIPLERTLGDLLQDWRERLGVPAPVRP